MADEPAAILIDTDRGRDGALADVLTVFAILWALAALFHVLGPSGRASDLLDDVTLLGMAQVVVCAAAIATLARPRWSPPLLALAASTIVTAWLEAPVLGNHWLVAAFVDVAILGAAISGRRGWRIGSDRARMAEVLLPLARWTLIAFYSFAAFAKLNHAFFDTTVSCGTFYFDELAGSLGFSTPITVDRGGWAQLVPVGVAGTELLIPLLLLFRRTRNAGVIAGLLFHGLIALDQTHLFSDFSSVLSALFVLFLPAACAGDAIDRFERLDSRLQGTLRGVTLGLYTVAVVLLVREGVSSWAFRDLRMWLWFITDALTVYVVVDYLRRNWATRLGHPLRLTSVPRWLWVVPVVVIFNGLMPYLEIKTAYSYNMYANLRTADGDTNHLLVPRTFPVNGNAADVVRLLETNDPGLQSYITLGYDLPYLTLRSYVSRHPDISLRYVRDGVEHAVARASDEPDLVRPVNELERRLFALRAVDQQDPPRCQDVFLPAL